MTEMIERVALAICEADCQRITPNELDRCRDLARAAIAAMGSPTEAMERAFDRAYWAKQHDNYSPTPTEHPEDGGGPFGYGYRAMMKAALAAPSL